MTEIIVCGYPKSGNTHLARLIGDLLDAPVTGFGTAHPLGEEGLGRESDHIVRQLHLYPTGENLGQFIYDPNTASLPCLADERVFFIVRDPRDVANSVYHFFRKKSIPDAMEWMNSTHGEGPFSHTWNQFNGAWMDELRRKQIAMIRYEDLVRQTRVVLRYIAEFLDVEVTDYRIVRTDLRNRIERRRRDINKFGDDPAHYPTYTKVTQLKNLRKGEPGDWKNFFNAMDLAYAVEIFGNLMERLGYLDAETRGLPDGTMEKPRRRS